MSPQIKSQLFGISLAFTTAVGCLAYERLVKSYSYFTVGLFVCLSYVPFWLAAVFFDNDAKRDFSNLSTNKWWILLYFLSGVTSPLWYIITRKQSVMVGAMCVDKVGHEPPWSPEEFLKLTKARDGVYSQQ